MEVMYVDGFSSRYTYTADTTSEFTEIDVVGKEEMIFKIDGREVSEDVFLEVKRRLGI